METLKLLSELFENDFDRDEFERIVESSNFTDELKAALFYLGDSADILIDTIIKNGENPDEVYLDEYSDIVHFRVGLKTDFKDYVYDYIQEDIRYDMKKVSNVSYNILNSVEIYELVDDYFEDYFNVLDIITINYYDYYIVEW